MAELTDYAVDLIFQDRLEEAENNILLETIEEELLRKVGEVTLQDYLIKFEAYLDKLDIYLFDGWEDAQVICRPKMEQFWANFYVQVGPKTDLRGAKRVLNDKEAQNKVLVKRLDDGSYLMKFRILRRLLDKMELEDKDRAVEIADSEDPTVMPQQP